MGLGAYLIGNGKFKESEIACLHALSLFISLFGEIYPETAQCRMNLAACFHYQGKYDKAMFEFSIAEKALVASLGPYHSETLKCRNNIANLLAETGKHEEARTAALELLADHIKVFGEESIRTGLAGIFAGYTFYLLKQYETAKEYYEKYLPVNIRIRGDQHPSVLRYKARLDEINNALS